MFSSMFAGWLERSLLFAGLLFALEAVFFHALGRIRDRRDKKAKGRRKQDATLLDFRYSRITGLALSSCLMLLLAVMKSTFFARLDDIFSCMYVFAGIAVVGIVATCGTMLAGKDDVRGRALKASLLKCVDDMLMVFSFVLAASVLGSEIAHSDMAKFFGAKVGRFVLVNLPFILCLVFMMLSNMCLLLQGFISRLGPKRANIANEVLCMVLFVATAFVLCWHFSLPFNIAGILAGGVLASFIIQEMPACLGRGRQSDKPVGLFLGLTKLLGLAAMDIMMLCAMVAVSLAWGGFYGLSLGVLGMTGGVMFQSAISELGDRGDSFRHVARAINGMVLFYIFAEALSFMLNKNVSISLFHSDVVFGLCLSMFLVVANIRKIVMVSRGLLLEHKRKYSVVEAFFYVAAIAAITAAILPFASYEMLGAFVLGVAIIAPLISLALSHVSSAAAGQDGVFDLIVLLNSQIATFTIVATILLLPLVR